MGAKAKTKTKTVKQLAEEVEILAGKLADLEGIVATLSRTVNAKGQHGVSQQNRVKIFVGNLNYSIDDWGLADLFKGFGTVKTATAVKDKYTGKPRGFGFVEMESREEAQSAIKALNGAEVKGRKLVVNESRPKGKKHGKQHHAPREKHEKRHKMPAGNDRAAAPEAQPAMGVPVEPEEKKKEKTAAVKKTAKKKTTVKKKTAKKPAKKKTAKSRKKK